MASELEWLGEGALLSRLLCFCDAPSLRAVSSFSAFVRFVRGSMEAAFEVRCVTWSHKLALEDWLKL